MDAEKGITLNEWQAKCNPLVLVVDDDINHQRLLELLADRLGITAHMASSCAEAVDALAMFSFDLILMDYRMPLIDGCLCTQRIRQMKEVADRIPIIAVTAHISPGSRERCLDAGMDDYLPKPFTLEELHAKICFWVKVKVEHSEKSADEHQSSESSSDTSSSG